MKIRTGKSLENLQAVKLSDEDLALEHRLDISASVYRRMKELGLNQKELAVKLGMNDAQVSRIITAKQNLTISTLAKIENALDINLGKGFRYESKSAVSLSMPYRRSDRGRDVPSLLWDKQGTWAVPLDCSTEGASRQGTSYQEMVA